MLQRAKKMFKFIKEQKKINKIIIISFLCVFITGCSQPVKEETSQAVVKEDEIQEDKGVQPVQEKKKEKLSEMYDWDKAKIPVDWYYPNFGEGQVLQNQDYIFYPEKGNKIIRIRKSDGMKEIICEFDYNKKADIHYCLADNGMFVEYASDIYFCGLDGKNQHKIISCKKLKKQITAIEDKGWMRGICTLYFYKDSLYLVSHYYMWKLDLTTKKITKMSELTMGGCFCGNTLYYMDLGQRAVYKTNIHTGKSTLALGNEEDSSTSYYGLTETDGKLYYVKCKGWSKFIVYMYRKGKKDKKIYKFNLGDSIAYCIKSESGKIIIHYRDDKREKDSIIIYDIKPSVVSKIENIKGFYDLVYIAGDMVFYAGMTDMEYDRYLSSLAY